VPDECRAIVRNVSSISEDLIEDTIENDYNDTFSELFSNNLALVLQFFTLQDKHDIHTLSVNIKLICTRCKAGNKRKLFISVHVFLFVCVLM
jgi:hypothetical protein